MHDITTIEVEKRENALLNGLRLLGKRQIAKYAFQEACRNCPFIRNDCAFQTSGGQSGGHLAFVLSDKSSGSKSRDNMRKVIRDEKLSIGQLPCEIMIKGLKASREYIGRGIKNLL
jgi:hypothetical protein